MFGVLPRLGHWYQGSTVNAIITGSVNHAWRLHLKYGVAGKRKIYKEYKTHLQRDIGLSASTTGPIWPSFTSYAPKKLMRWSLLTNLLAGFEYFWQLSTFPAFSWIDRAWSALTWGRPEIPGWNVVVYSNNYKLEKKKVVLCHLRMLAHPITSTTTRTRFSFRKLGYPITETSISSNS